MSKSRSNVIPITYKLRTSLNGGWNTFLRMTHRHVQCAFIKDDCGASRPVINKYPWQTLRVF